MPDGDIEIGESTPLFSDEPHDDDDDEDLRDIKECTRLEAVVGGAAAATGITSLITLIFEGGMFPRFSGAAGLIVSPYGAFQQQKMTDISALKETNEHMREEVDNLKSNNDDLQKHTAELDASAENLKELEETLQTIRDAETKSLAELEEQVKEQREILKGFDEDLEQRILMSLTECVINCDKDGDETLDDDEIDLLITKIQNIYGVDVKEKRFKALVIGGGRSL
eukprot:CAMPEP_0183306826 /NCGR_PEP_ID=MMETSP0160_2-20130417/14850_1 /TAXON_ID=2839 ORGANISM="Odontella Sinensis, Strain Grunow 1884" /NCGR_SAMPLE_ID=MMETSP0160_2 /ASSEMBLY_ACC=CAM_ASM_000250 /LENGTH=224 /DNA_ID=CAMNT_0025470293 /DNA_START=97 /DNA_END=768 /DNA_ORIENTATION=+